MHDRFPGVTAVDLNRAGVPLVEIVSEPDIRSSAEADAYLRALKQILEYVDVSDVNMEEGSLRVDANISARPFGETTLGTKTEVKNMNSFSAVVRALEVEFARQCAVLDAGGAIEQQTMLWDDEAGQVRPARSKEGSHDYRYFPEPDLAAAGRSARAHRAAFATSLPELPEARRARYRAEFPALTDYDIDVLTASAGARRLLRARRAARAATPRRPPTGCMGEVLAALKATGQAIDAFHRAARRISPRCSPWCATASVSHSAAKQIFARHGRRPAIVRTPIAEREGLLKVSDDAALIALDRRSVRRVSRRGAALRRRRAAAAGRARRPRDEAVEGQRRSEARQSVVGGARWRVERAAEAATRSASVGRRHAEVAVGLVAEAQLVAVRAGTCRRTRFARRSASSPDGSS